MSDERISATPLNGDSKATAGSVQSGDMTWLRITSLVVTLLLTAILAYVVLLNVLCGALKAIALGMMHAPPDRIPVTASYGIQPAFLIDLVGITLAWVAFAYRWHVTAMVVAFVPIPNEAAIWYSQTDGLESRQIYEKVDGVWYYADYNMKGRLARRLEADHPTFQIVSLDKYFCYGKDKDRAYWNEHPIPGSDPGSFVVLGGTYSRDKAKVYCGTLAMHVPDPTKFEVIQPGSSTHHAGKESFLELFGAEFADVDLGHGVPLVGSGWGRDGTSYYFGPTRVIDADYDTFQILDSPLHDTAKDKNGKFRGWRRE